ncbi:MAG: hypothetical protein HC932_03995 [Thermales bacterium]|nr:hypothetical protein [Thermales bacterium]
MRAETDTIGLVNWDWLNQPGVTNLLQINYLLSGKNKQEVVRDWTGNKNYGDLKKETARIVEDFLINLQSKKAEITDQQIQKVLYFGEENANKKAKEVLLKFQKHLGLDFDLKTV